MAAKVKSVFALIHPFWGLTEPKINNKYSEKEAEEMMSRWKALVDRVKWDKNAVLYIEPVHNEMAADLLRYAHGEIPPERMIVNLGDKDPRRETQINDLGKKVGKKTSLFLCGEKAESCVESSGSYLKQRLKINPNEVFLMHDLSVTWFGKKGKPREIDSTYKRDLEKMTGEKFTKRFLNSEGRVVPKTPSQLNEKAEKMRVLKQIQKEHGQTIVPKSKKAYEKMSLKRGFSTLPRQRFKGKK